jgi:lysophospholipase L1-like esterase
VVFASVATWTATTNGAGGSIAMPDGVHPNAAGYQTMADFWVRDHAALFS